MSIFLVMFVMPLLRHVRCCPWPETEFDFQVAVLVVLNGSTWHFEKQCVVVDRGESKECDAIVY